MSDENFIKEIDSIADIYTLNLIIGKIKGVIINYRKGFIDMESALLRIEKIINSIDDF